MGKILSTSVTEEQFDIIKKIAEMNNVTVSSLLKDSIKVYMLLYYLNDVMEKVKFNETVAEPIQTNAKILDYANKMATLMQPYYDKLFSSIPEDMKKFLEEEGHELAETIETYEKPVKRGRPPKLKLSKKRR